MSSYLILLPPSEMKIPGGKEELPYRMVKNLSSKNTFQSLESSREYLYARLREALVESPTAELEKAFGVKGKRLHEVVDLMADIFNQPTCPASLRYAGVMYDAIDYSSLSQKQRERFDARVYMVDGLFGLLKATDYIPEYKLKIDSRFLGIKVDKFWREALVQVFDELIRDKVVVDLLPEAHRSVLSFQRAKQVYRLQFAEYRQGTVKASGHASKQLKGELMRYILEHDSLDFSHLQQFTHSKGYAYADYLTTTTEKVTSITYLKE